MNIEQRNSPEYIKKFTPALNYLQDLGKNIPETEKIPIIEESSERRKKLLEQELMSGKQISSESDFRYWLQLLKKNNIIDIKTPFTELNNGNPIVIQNNQWKDIYPFPLSVFYVHPEVYNGINGRLGFIDTKGKFISSLDKTHSISYTPSFPSSQKESLVEKKEDKNIIIKKGHTLWKLIEKNYDLSGSENPNRDIANIALRLEKLQQNKGKIKNGNIFIGTTIFMPSEISTIRIPKEEKRFSLKQTETI